MSYFYFRSILRVILRLLSIAVTRLGVFSRDKDGEQMNKLPRTNDGEYVINLDDKKGKGTHWFSLFIDKNEIVYFDSFGIEYIPQEVLSKIKKNQ